MAYTVRTPSFSGPFDLLLQLVRREQLEIYDISIARITDAYLAETDRMQSCDLEAATEFLVIAAILVEMKARRMLPGKADADPDEELEATSERDLLLARMAECSAFRSASAMLEQLIEEAGRSRPRCMGLIEERWLNLAPALLEGVEPVDVHAAYERAMAAPPAPRVDITHITPISVTVGEAVTELANRLAMEGRISFRVLTSGIEDRIGLVVRFLAVLELVKQGLADVEQATTFGEIVVSWTGARQRSLQAVAAGVDAYDG